MAEFFCRLCDKGLGIRPLRLDEVQGRSRFGLWQQWVRRKLRVWGHGWLHHPRELYRHWRDA